MPSAPGLKICPPGLDWVLEVATPPLPVKGNLAVCMVLSLLTAAGMAVFSVAGLVFQGVFYTNEALQQAFIPNDAVNMVIGVPLLVFSMMWANRGYWTGLLLWPGALFYVTYTYIAYAAAASFLLIGAGYAALAVLSVVALIWILCQMDLAAIQQRLNGNVPRRLAGWVLTGLGMLFLLRSIWQLAASSGGLAPTDRAVLLADLLTTPAWIAGGGLLLRRRALGSACALGLLFQASMLFVGLLAVFLLQPWLTDAPFPLGDFAVVLAMGMVCFVPLGLYLRGVVRSLSDE